MSRSTNRNLMIACIVTLVTLTILRGWVDRHHNDETNGPTWICLEEGAVRTAVAIKRGGNASVDFNSPGKQHLAIHLCDRKSAVEWAVSP